LTLLEKVDKPLVFMQETALTCAAMSGCAVDQGMAMAWLCLLKNLDPMEAARKYHFFGRVPTMKYDAMLQEFCNKGGVFTVLERTPERAALRMTLDDQTYEVDYEWKEAEISRWPWKDWKDHSKGLKDNWATPTDRKIMLFARLVSDTIKTHFPKVIAGAYTPEEVMDMEGDESGGTSLVVDTEVLPSVEEVMERVKAEAEAVVVEDVPFDDGTPLGEGFATKEQLEQLQELLAELEIGHEVYSVWYAKRHAEHARNLKQEEIQEIVDKLEAVKQQRLSEGN
jgi:hypothetical protein